MGLMSTVEMVMKENPEFTAEQAAQHLVQVAAAESATQVTRRNVVVDTAAKVDSVDSDELGDEPTVQQPRNGPLPS
jgi:hypothetical protein